MERPHDIFRSQFFSRRQVIVTSGLAAAAGATLSLDAHANPGKGGKPLPTLAEPGRVRCTVLVAADADAYERQAADEIATLLEEVSGIPVPRAGDAGVVIHVGGAAVAARPGLIDGLSDHGFRVVQEDARILLAGGTSLGTLYAAYDLLERLGFRFLAPGPHGTYVPAALEKLRRATLLSEPHFSHRVLQGIDRYIVSPYPGDDLNEAKRWTERNRLDIRSFGAHEIPLDPPTNKNLEPHLYIQADGKPTNQLNVTLPEVLERAVAAARKRLTANPGDPWLNLGPADGAGFGVTEWDVADRFDPLYGELVVTDRYIKFFNLMLEQLRPEFPDVRIAFYAYHLYMEPPVREQPDPALVPVFAPIAVSRRNSIEADDGWERRYVLRVIREWEALGLEWMYRGYITNLADPAGPFCAAGQVAKEVPAFAAAGAKHGFRMECLQGWGYGGVSYYLISKLLWDPTLDPQAVLDDYFEKSYGRAARAMQQYFDRLIAVHELAPFTAGGVFDLLPSVGSSMTELEGFLRDAERRARDEGTRARIQTVRLAHDTAVAQLAAQQALAEGTFAKALDLSLAAESTYDTAATAVPAANYPFTKRYIPRFITDVARPAAEHEAKMVALLPELWQAQIDNTDLGEERGLHLVGADPEGWTEMETATRTWSAQGLRYFRGSVWYRTQVALTSSGTGLRLWLSSIDDTAKVWVNGIECPQVISGGAFLGRGFDISAAVLSGQSNTVVVRVTSWILDELGTGGLMGRAFVYADGDPHTGPTPTPVSAGEAPARPKAVTTRGTAVDGDWELILDPYAAGPRIGLVEPQISSQHFRPVDPAKPWADQGLALYEGDVVLRTTFTNQPGSPHRKRGLHLPWDTTGWRAFVNGVEVPAASGGFDLSAELSKVRGRRNVSLALTGPLDGASTTHGAISLLG